MSYLDKILSCSDCARPFKFSAEDQGLSGELGYGQPVRCRSCLRSRETTRRHSGRNPVPVLSVPRIALPFPPTVLARPTSLT